MPPKAHVSMSIRKAKVIAVAILYVMAVGIMAIGGFRHSPTAYTDGVLVAGVIANIVFLGWFLRREYHA